MDDRQYRSISHGSRHRRDFINEHLRVLHEKSAAALYLELRHGRIGGFLCLMSRWLNSLLHGSCYITIQLLVAIWNMLGSIYAEKKVNSLLQTNMFCRKSKWGSLSEWAVHTYTIFKLSLVFTFIYIYVHKVLRFSRNSSLVRHPYSEHKKLAC